MLETIAAAPAHNALQANPILVAIDRPDLAGATLLAEDLAGHVGGIKLGLEFFVSNGATGVRRMAEVGLPIFLDLKLHDIPNTVAGAMTAAANLPVAMVTVHSGGGPAMVAAAADAAANAIDPPLVLGVTVLTSMDQADLKATGVDGAAADQVLRLARLAIEAGADGLVCSPLEVALLRRELGPDPVLVVPGIRMQSVGDDQKRTLTPKEAVEAGASWLVVGRPITKTADPAAAANTIVASLG